MDGTLYMGTKYLPYIKSDMRAIVDQETVFFPNRLILGREVYQVYHPVDIIDRMYKMWIPHAIAWKTLMSNLQLQKNKRGVKRQNTIGYLDQYTAQNR